MATGIHYKKYYRISFRRKRNDSRQYFKSEEEMNTGSDRCELIERIYINIFASFSSQLYDIKLYVAIIIKLYYWVYM
jgi:hypothetical protein